MKKILLPMLTIMCATSLSCQANQKQSDEGTSVVPKMYLDVINKADSVTVLLIDPWSEATDDWMDGYGEVLSSTTSKDKDLKVAFYKTLSNPKAFEIHEMIKDCAFMPDVAVVFHKKKGNVIVAYSFYCDVCRFAQGEKYVDFDGELVRLDFLEVVSKACPKDRYIRYLIKRTKSDSK